MKHSLQNEGFGIRLRPVRIEDAAFIVWLRNLDRTKGRVGDSAADVVAQESWLEAYFGREGDYYFIIETFEGIPAGTVGIYDFSASSAEVGRLVVRPDMLAAVPAMALVFDLAYSQFEFTATRGTVVAGNLPMHNFIRNFGHKEVEVQRAAQIIGGQPVDMVHYLQSAEDWLKARERLTVSLHLAAEKIQDWEKRRQLLNLTIHPWEA